MELELQQTRLNGFRMIFDRTVTQEETMEGIVPDSRPDIMRIVDASAQPGLFTRELSAGGLRISGMVRACILYLPEGEDGPRSMELQIPVHCTVDDPAFHANCKIQLFPRVCSVDARALNPRKVLVRAEVALAVRAFGAEETDLCVAARCREMGDCLQQQLEEQSIYLVSAVQEKSFAFSDVFDLPASRPAARELLRARLDPGEAEAKIIGSRLVVKGEAALCVLYRTDGGMLCIARFQLPYSQILEAGGAGEEADAQAEVTLAGLECTLQPGEPGSIAVNVELLVQATVRENRTVTLLTDLYATNCLLEAQRSTFPMERLVGRENRVERVRQMCECGIPVKTVVDLSLAMGRVTQSREGEKTVFRAETTVTILFLSEDDALCSVTYPIPAVSEWSVPEGCDAACRCRGGEELTAVPVTGGLEVRFEAQFRVLTLRTASSPFVSAVRELPAPAQTGERPSVILRMAGEGESLWEIAKAYGSTTADIAAANGLEDETAPAGMMLLIPRRR